MEYQRFK